MATAKREAPTEGIPTGQVNSNSPRPSSIHHQQSFPLRQQDFENQFQLNDGPPVQGGDMKKMEASHDDSHPLVQDYTMQLMLLEQQNKKRSQREQEEEERPREKQRRKRSAVKVEPRNYNDPRFHLQDYNMQLMLLEQQNRKRLQRERDNEELHRMARDELGRKNPRPPNSPMPNNEPQEHQIQLMHMEQQKKGRASVAIEELGMNNNETPNFLDNNALQDYQEQLARLEQSKKNKEQGHSSQQSQKRPRRARVEQRRNDPQPANLRNDYPPNSPPAPGNHAIQDYQTQLSLLEQMIKKRKEQQPQVPFPGNYQDWLLQQQQDYQRQLEQLENENKRRLMASRLEQEQRADHPALQNYETPQGGEQVAGLPGTPDSPALMGYEIQLRMLREVQQKREARERQEAEYAAIASANRQELQSGQARLHQASPAIKQEAQIRKAEADSPKTLSPSPEAPMVKTES